MPSTIASIVMGGGGEDAAERPSVASLSGPLLLPPPPVRWLFPLISSIILPNEKTIESHGRFDRFGIKVSIIPPFLSTTTDRAGARRG